MIRGNFISSPGNTSQPTETASSGIYDIREQQLATDTTDWSRSSYFSGSLTKLLLHFNGTNGSTTFTDSSGLSHTVTPSGNASISTTQSKFNGASGRFDGNGHVLLDGSSDFNFGTGDFTVDFWIRFNSTPGAYQLIYDSRTAGSDNCFWIQYASSTWTAGYAGSTIVSGGGTTVGVWQHIAVTRASGVWRLFVDGIKVSTSAINYIDLGNFSNRPAIATQGDGIGFGRPDCYLDELRVAKGAAIWTSSFVPPLVPYT